MDEETDGEIEITIEYYESIEADPLSDKKFNCVREEIENGTEGVKNRLKQFNFVQNSENVLDHTNTKDTIVTWHKSIDNSGRFLCKFCNLKYSTIQSLRYHVKAKHPAQANNIKKELIKHKRNSKLKCHICKQYFKEISVLTTHVQNDHSLEDIRTSCLYCDATFSSEYEMSQHLLIQHKKVIKESTYMCNICAYRTLSKSHFNQHKNAHLADEVTKCQYCDYATKNVNNLKIHERIHTNDKVYACDFMNCEYRCTAKTALRSHQWKHYPEENVLYCDKCSYKTVYRQSLKRHEDCHKRNSVRLKLL